MKQTKLVLTAALIAALLSGCAITKDSPAPGCVERVGLPMMGGCFGKTAILDLTVEPATDCLAISVNNCNGGVLDVRNNCDEPFVLGGVEIPPQEYVILDAVAKDGEYTLQEASSNFTAYVPDTDTSVEFVGQLGEQEIRVAFTKTAALCE
jgi:hypothetical protein